MRWFVSRARFRGSLLLPPEQVERGEAAMHAQLAQAEALAPVVGPEWAPEAQLAWSRQSAQCFETESSGEHVF